jgi:hypothetical protein
MNKQHKPQDLPKKYTIKMRLKGYGNSHINYNFIDRNEWHPSGWKLNKKVLGKIHGHLHYLACHSPLPVQKKWRTTYDIFQNKHFGSFKGSVRYLNKWSCHAWL